ncbi:ABC transporter permease subunit [Bacillus sp. NTK071]|uniref:ABC transporter permease subunit n=1 Tax=Bacillus sp. NTK071 TaxID=2802175 RepID=UPI001A8C3FDF|nr:ABC transporter permease subunit [Bacillus sp. NTK071]MBN8209180.1 ABC transporter permease subunit [Bacillus sp. NTK071]
MLRKALRNPMFVSGTLVVLILFGSSLYYSIVFHDQVPQTSMLYNDEGNLIDRSPLGPTQVPPFGTDKYGYHLFQQIIIGAKYTIGIAFIVASMRMALSFVGGVLAGTYFQRTLRSTSGLVDAMQYVPISLLSYFILRGVLMENGMEGTFQYSFIERVIFEVIILTAVAIPTTTTLISNETHAVWGKGFIEGAKTLGGSRIHILYKHILPHLGPRMILIFLQQMVNVLVLLLHLGLLKLFFGGTFFNYDPLLGNEYLSVSSEWSGMIGYTFNLLPYETWIPLIPILFFVLVILGVNFALEGFKQAMEKQIRVRRSNPTLENNEAVVNQDSFSFINDRSHLYMERKHASSYK